MRWRIPIVVLLALFVAVSCDQQPAAPQADQAVAEAPVFNWMNGPEMSGVVTRGEADFSLLFDYTRDETEKVGEPWMIFMGWGIDDYHSTCGGSNSSTPWEMQTVRDVIKLYMNKKMGVTIFPFSEFFGNYMSAPVGVDPVWYASCETTRIAGGTAQGTGHFTPAGEQYTVHGKIDYMGETYRFKWGLKFFGKDGFRRTMRVW